MALRLFWTFEGLLSQNGWDHLFFLFVIEHYSQVVFWQNIIFFVIHNYFIIVFSIYYMNSVYMNSIFFLPVSVGNFFEECQKARRISHYLSLKKNYSDWLVALQEHAQSQTWAPVHVLVVPAKQNSSSSVLEWLVTRHFTTLIRNPLASRHNCFAYFKSCIFSSSQAATEMNVNANVWLFLQIL